MACHRTFKQKANDGYHGDGLFEALHVVHQSIDKTSLSLSTTLETLWEGCKMDPKNVYSIKTSEIIVSLIQKNMNLFSQTNALVFRTGKYIVMVDFMIIFLDSVCVGQFAKKNRSESFVCLFVCSFSRVSGSGESWEHRVHQRSRS